LLSGDGGLFLAEARISIVAELRFSVAARVCVAMFLSRVTI
jgi:hypothetical protein